MRITAISNQYNSANKNNDTNFGTLSRGFKEPLLMPFIGKEIKLDHPLIQLLQGFKTDGKNRIVRFDWGELIKHETVPPKTDSFSHGSDAYEEPGYELNICSIKPHIVITPSLDSVKSPKRLEHYSKELSEMQAVRIEVDNLGDDGFETTLRTARDIKKGCYRARESGVYYIEEPEDAVGCYLASGTTNRGGVLLDEPKTIQTLKQRCISYVVKRLTDLLTPEMLDKAEEQVLDTLRKDYNEEHFKPRPILLNP